MSTTPYTAAAKENDDRSIYDQEKTESERGAHARKDPNVLAPEDFAKIEAENNRKVKQGVATYDLSRRTVYQTWGHLDAALDRLWSFRDRARKSRRFEEVQYLTEAIFHLKRASAYLDLLSIREFSRDADDLEAYK